MNWRVPSNVVMAMRNEQWRTLLFAGVLFVAQFLFQLHGLQHLDESDQGEHSEEYCVVCILGSALDSGALPGLSAANYPDPFFGQIEYSYSFVHNYTFDAFSVRAPPLHSSFA